MALPANTFYPHRRNTDGSYDTICPKCFATVAHARTEAEIVEYNQQHVCDGTGTWHHGALIKPL